MSVKLSKKIDVFLRCPICNETIKNSNYLKKIFKNNKWALWAANLVTHYRHQHIKYYDRSWKYSYYRQKNPEYKSYDSFKKLVNNRAKRQLIRAIKKYDILSIEDRIQFIQAFNMLQFNDEQTKELIKKSILKLDGK